MKPAISTSKSQSMARTAIEFLRPYRDGDKAWEDDVCVSATCTMAEAPVTA